MRRAMLAAALALGLCGQVRAHDVSTTPITWNREISRIFYQRCLSCHRPGGTSFSLATYQDVQPKMPAFPPLPAVAAPADAVRVEPLLWLYGYSDRFRHSFVLRKPLPLPAGTIIRGVRPPASMLLLPASSSGAH